MWHDIRGREPRGWDDWYERCDLLESVAYRVAGRAIVDLLCGVVPDQLIVQPRGPAEHFDHKLYDGHVRGPGHPTAEGTLLSLVAGPVADELLYRWEIWGVPQAPQEMLDKMWPLRIPPWASFISSELEQWGEELKMEDVRRLSFDELDGMTRFIIEYRGAEAEALRLSSNIYGPSFQLGQFRALPRYELIYLIGLARELEQRARVWLRRNWKACMQLGNALKDPDGTTVSGEEVRSLVGKLSQPTTRLRGVLRPAAKKPLRRNRVS
jgi:hypothetical protein